MEQHLAMDEVGEGAVPVTSLSLEPGQARGIGTTLRASPGYQTRAAAADRQRRRQPN